MRAHVAFAAAALAGLLSACETLPPILPDDWPGPQVPGPSAELSATALDASAVDDPALPDASVRAAVEQRLSVEGALARDVRVRVDDGVVTLTGTTRDLVARDRAVDQAADVRGVRGVVDDIEVDPPARRDAAIADDVRDALASSSALADRDLQVTVRDGYVTLQGQVERGAEARAARDLARSVVGVRDVANRVQVSEQADVSDDRVRTSLARALRLDARLADRVIDVDVDEGIATLSGTVDSAAERERAADLALAAGAEFVDVRGLDVNGFEDDEPRPLARSPDPGVVEDAVLAALSRDPRLDDGVVRAEVDEGVVTLRGTVGTVAARESAEALSREARGVRDVRNLVEVRPGREVSDAEISARVEEVIARDPWLFESDLTVLVDDGEVTLAGELPSRYARARAGELVASVEGVTEVDARRLTVPDRGRMSDDELRVSVLEQLYWNPDLDPSTLEVRVEGGVVWLGGEARDAIAVASARESAFLAGATSVVNEIEVPTSPPDVRTTIRDDPAYLERSPFGFDTPFNRPPGEP